jgi:hypothetical protein
MQMLMKMPSQVMGHEILSVNMYRIVLDESRREECKGELSVQL